MRIWIDGFEANVAQRLGSSQVAFELLRNLEELDRENDYTILLSSNPLEDLPKERPGWKYHILKAKRFKTYIGIPQALYSAKEKPDLIFSPTHYGPISAPCKKVITIFDLSFLRYPKTYKKRDLYQLKLWTRISVKGADHIITISESSKKDIMKFYGVPENRISVIYPGYDETLFHPIKEQKSIHEVLERYGIVDSYIIYIGTVQPRKNLVRLIEAFKDVADPNLKLVIVGKTSGQGRQGWMFQETLDAPKKFGIEDKVIFTGFVPTEDLPYLLSGAKAYCLPSLFEGFGIPVVEAMATGTPVIVSNVSSLPEIVGGAGLLVDPNSIGSITTAIEKICTNKKLRDDLVKKGLAQAGKFSWEKAAKELLEVFKTI